MDYKQNERGFLKWYGLLLRFNLMGSTGSTIVNTYQSREEAESKFHLILSVAAVSSVPKHGAVLFSDVMSEIMTKVYEHPIKEETNEQE